MLGPLPFRLPDPVSHARKSRCVGGQLVRVAVRLPTLDCVGTTREQYAFPGVPESVLESEQMPGITVFAHRRALDTEEVAGSNPVVPTIIFNNLAGRSAVSWNFPPVKPRLLPFFAVSTSIGQSATLAESPSLQSPEQPTSTNLPGVRTSRA